MVIRALKKTGQRLLLVTLILVLGVIIVATWQAFTSVTGGGVVAALEHTGLGLLLFLVGFQFLVASADLLLPAIVLFFQKGG